MFAASFATAGVTCIVENDAWMILEERDPQGLRGCGFFHVVGGKIAFQCRYWDELSFLRLHGLTLPDS